MVTIAPLDPIALFADEVAQVRRLLGPGQRKRTEAEARLCGLAIVTERFEESASSPDPAS